MGCNTLDTNNNFHQGYDKDPLNLCEMFISIQGEGKDSGAHALFIRLSGCNLRCEWCDTKHSWNKEKTISQDKIIELMCEYRDLYKNNYIVWTGGEPLLQEFKLYAIIEKTRDFYHMIETNGTIIPEKPHMFNAIAVSPKEGMRFDGKRWIQIRNSYIKLVVDTIEEAIAFQKQYQFPCQWFFVMTKTDYPLNILDYLKKEKHIFKQCIEHGFNYSPRLQLYYVVK